MGIKRIVDVGFWTDDKVIDMFSPEDKLFMLYLMTNPHTTQLGIYAINIKIMAFELGYSTDAIKVLIDRFENKYNMIRYSEEYKEIAIKNYLKHSIIKGGKPVEDLLLKEISNVKDVNSLIFVYDNLKYCETINDTVKKILEYINPNEKENDKQNDNDNDNENEKSYPQSYNDSCHDSLSNISAEIISRLNELTGSNFKSSGKATKDLIKNLLKEYTKEDILMVVDKMCYKWGNDAKMSEYLRPSTLFRRSNFENYYGMKVQANEMTINDLNIDTSDFFRE